MDTLYKRIWVFPVFVTTLTTFLVSLSLWNSVLVGDEEFVVFSFGPELANDPSKIISWAINSAVGGWQQGRFISPITHLLSNTGTWATYVTSELLGVDVIFAYGLWRLILMLSISITALAIVYWVTNNATKLVRFYTLLLFSLVIPGLMIANHPWAATRVSIWSYNLTLLMFLLFTLALTIIASKQNKQSIGGWISCIFMAALGVLFATTYELTQVLAPVGLFLYLAIRQKDQHNLENVGHKSVLNRMLNNLFSIQSLTFILFFIIPFGIIRVSSFIICRSGCYQTANIKPGSFQIHNLVDRWISVNPVSEISYGLSENPNWSNSKTSLIAISVVILLFFLVLLSIARKLTNSVKLLSDGERTSQNINTFILLGFGLLIGLLLSFGMAMSQAVQEGENQFGIGSRDTLAQNLGSSFVITGFVLLLLQSRHLSQLLAVRTIVQVIISGYLALIIGLGLATNAVVTKTSLASEGNFLQSRLSAEIFVGDVSASGDKRRCDLAIEKLSKYPDWEGHDKSIMYGLNLAMQRKYGIDFCTIKPEVIFENYSGGK